MIAFFLVEFAVVFVTLALIQLAGLGSFSPYIAGFIGGVTAVVGSVVFWWTGVK